MNKKEIIETIKTRGSFELRKQKVTTLNKIMGFLLIIVRARNFHGYDEKGKTYYPQYILILQNPLTWIFLLVIVPLLSIPIALFTSDGSCYSIIKDSYDYVIESRKEYKVIIYRYKFFVVKRNQYDNTSR